METGERDREERLQEKDRRLLKKREQILEREMEKGRGARGERHMGERRRV